MIDKSRLKHKRRKCMMLNYDTVDMVMEILQGDMEAFGQAIWDILQYDMYSDVPDKSDGMRYAAFRILQKDDDAYVSNWLRKCGDNDAKELEAEREMLEKLKEEIEQGVYDKLPF